jgi:hypothetical protein
MSCYCIFMYDVTGHYKCISHENCPVEFKLKEDSCGKCTQQVVGEHAASLQSTSSKLFSAEVKKVLDDFYNLSPRESVVGLRNRFQNDPDRLLPNEKQVANFRSREKKAKEGSTPITL